MTAFRRHPLAATTLTVLLAVASLGAAALPTAAASSDGGRATKVSGTFVNPAPGAVCTDGQVRDPGVGQGYIDFECTGTSFLSGSWTGTETSELNGTWDLSTGDIQGTTRATFIGRAADGSFATLEREGTATCDGETFWCHVEERIIDGTGDFEGSQGHVTFEGTLVGNVGSGEYWGLWIRP